MTGGENDMTTSTELSVKLIEEMSGLRGDIREIMTTMRHFDQKLDRVNDDIKEIKVIANEASSLAESADVKAQTAMRNTELNKTEIEKLNKKIEDTEKEQRIQRRYGMSTTIAVVGIILTAINYFWL